jgi:hemerythrin
MKMIEMINTLHDAMKEGKGRDILGRILEDLVAYTRTHFETEEKVMKQNSYPDFSEHKKQHDKLVMEVAKIVKNYHGGNEPLPAHIMQFLVDWLTTHINGVDKKYGPYLQSKGVA